MFEDSLFDSGAGKRARKNWPKLLSFVIEIAAICVLVLLPLIYTQALPKQLWTSVLENPAPPAGAAPVKELKSQTRAPREKNELADNVLRQPDYIPNKTAMVHDEPASSEETHGAIDGLVPGGIPGGVPNALTNEITKAVSPVMVKPVPPQRPRVSSGVAAGMLVQQVKPRYPALAVQAHVQGTVVLQAVIGKDGTVRDLHLVSGHPMLAGAAIEAVKQWRYRPYLLNNEPVEVDTQINVNFTLGGGS
jgi:protein TonB